MLRLMMTKSQVITWLVNRALSGDLNLKQLVESMTTHDIPMCARYYIACCIAVNSGCSKAGQLAEFNRVYPALPNCPLPVGE